MRMALLAEQAHGGVRRCDPCLHEDLGQED